MTINKGKMSTPFPQSLHLSASDRDRKGEYGDGDRRTMCRSQSSDHRLFLVSMSQNDSMYDYRNGPRHMIPTRETRRGGTPHTSPCRNRRIKRKDYSLFFDTRSFDKEKNKQTIRNSNSLSFKSHILIQSPQFTTTKGRLSRLLRSCRLCIDI